MALFTNRAWKIAWAVAAAWAAIWFSLYLAEWYYWSVAHPVPERPKLFESLLTAVPFASPPLVLVGMAWMVKTAQRWYQEDE